MRDRVGVPGQGQGRVSNPSYGVVIRGVAKTNWYETSRRGRTGAEVVRQAPRAAPGPRDRLVLRPLLPVPLDGSLGLFAPLTGDGLAFPRSLPLLRPPLRSPLLSLGGMTRAIISLGLTAVVTPSLRTRSLTRTAASKLSSEEMSTCSSAGMSNGNAWTVSACRGCAKVPPRLRAAGASPSSMMGTSQ